MSQRNRGKKNNISVRGRIHCLLNVLSDPKQSTNPTYANSNRKIVI